MTGRERIVWPERRHDYRWDADRSLGFEKSTLIYDAEGRLIGVDHSPSTPVRRPEPPKIEREQ